jgi:hypothetical protein
MRVGLSYEQDEPFLARAGIFEINPLVRDDPALGQAALHHS